jgi:hypothetical protein
LPNSEEVPMRKAFFVSLVAAAFATLAFAGGPGCDHSKKAEVSKSGCSAHMTAVSDGFTLMQEDVTALKAGVPAADEAAFLKTHTENLEKLLKAKGECESTCGSHRASMAASCPHMDPMAAGFKVLSQDLDALKKGLDPASQKAFLDAHAQHLQKVIDLRDDCMKTCHAKSVKADKT